MTRPSIVPQIKAQLEIWLEQRMGFKWDVGHELPGRVGMASSDAGPPPANAQRVRAI
jgi:hypothetical protein